MDSQSCNGGKKLHIGKEPARNNVGLIAERRESGKGGDEHLLQTDGGIRRTRSAAGRKNTAGSYGWIAEDTGVVRFPS